MMNYAELVALEQMLRGRLTLSVFLDGEVTSAATRTAWRRRVEHSIDDVRESLACATPAEHAAFERSVALLTERLAPFTGALGSAGWAAFVSEEAVHFAEPLSVPVPSSISWGHGPRVLPLIRPLKLNRAATVCLADGRSTRLFRYRRGKLERLTAPRLAERADEGHEVEERVDRVLELCSPDDWLLFGGSPAVATAMVAALRPRLARRAAVLPPLPACAGEFEIGQAAERVVTSLRRTYEQAIVEAVLLRSGAGGCSVASADRTEWALRQRAVEELVVTRRFVDRHADLAEALLRRAFDQGAMVEGVCGSAAERLDAAGGVGALLREGHRSPPHGVAVVCDDLPSEREPAFAMRVASGDERHALR